MAGSATLDRAGVGLEQMTTAPSAKSALFEEQAMEHIDKVVSSVGRTGKVLLTAEP